jgi:hypothetical protein
LFESVAAVPSFDHSRHAWLELVKQSFAGSLDEAAVQKLFEDIYESFAAPAAWQIFDDVRPAREIDFSDSAANSRVVTKTFDGLKVTVNVKRQGADYWAIVSADAFKPEADGEASAINAHASGWAYKLPAYKGQLFMTTLDSLLKAPAPHTQATP